MGWGRGATLLASVGPWEWGEQGEESGSIRLWGASSSPFSLWEPPLHSGNGISRGKALRGLHGISKLFTTQVFPKHYNRSFLHLSQDFLGKGDLVN